VNPSLDSLRSTAKLFGWLLLRELDEPLLAHLREPTTREGLRSVGIEVPDESCSLEALHGEYYDCFLAAEGSTPIVQSLWEGGSYDGPARSRLQKLADASALEIDRDAVRGAPVDHLGCILQLWAQLIEEWPDRAALLARDHLEWARPPLRTISERNSFYGELAAAVVDLLERIKELEPRRKDSQS
jgi:TorA maturation chaperone TorD